MGETRPRGTGRADPPPGSSHKSAGHGDLEVVVNGVAHALVSGATVSDLVSTWCPSPDGIAVARNREVVPRSEWHSTPLLPHDLVEIVTAAAGG